MRPFIFATTLAVLFGAGCAATEKVKLSSDGEPEYKKLRIVYECKPEASFVRLDQPPDVQQAGFDFEETKPDQAKKDDTGVDEGKSSVKKVDRKKPRTANSRLRLEIEYPHAGANPEFAQATLYVVTNPDRPVPDMRGVSNSSKRFESPPAAQVRVGEEVLVLELPKKKLDALLFDLAHDGFFGDANPEAGESRVDVTLDRGQVAKKWKREPSLDELVSLLRHRGKPSKAKRQAT